MADVESKSIPHELPSSHWLKATGQCVLERYLSATIGGTKVCPRHLGHMTNMAITPIYGKNPSKIFFSGTGGPISTKLGM